MLGLSCSSGQSSSVFPELTGGELRQEAAGEVVQNLSLLTAPPMHFPGGKGHDLGLYCAWTTQLGPPQARLGKSASL